VKKICEIKGGSQEMAAMVIIMPQSLLKFISINIIAAISWPLPLNSQLFHPGFLSLYHLFTAWLFLPNRTHVECSRTLYLILHMIRKFYSLSTFNIEIKGGDQ